MKYTKCEYPTEAPCLMVNDFNEVFLVTDGPNEKKYVTRVGSGKEEVETWESDLKYYKPLPRGSKIEFTN